MAPRCRESRPFLAWATLGALASAAPFYGLGRAACGGSWPAPLDDVYIHYDFARAWATGHPFAWIAGQGYSSGETSPAYAILLAVGYAIGFRRAWIGVWAALVALGSFVLALRALRSVTRSGRHAGWVVALSPAILVACGTLDFAWWSGMEVALFGAVAATWLAAVDRARLAGPFARPRAQWAVGALGALLVLVRPESAVIVAVSAVIVARRSGAASPVASCVRVALPGAAATVGVAALNLAFTGRAASAGALLKLLSSNPFASDVDRARDYVTNLVTLARALALDLGDAQGRTPYLLLVLAGASLFARRTRGLGALCLGSALLFMLLVSWNGAARYQNLRDYMPAVTLALFGAVLGLSALAATRIGLGLGVALTVVGAGLGLTHVPASARLYARAARNIHDQQVTVGERLARVAPAHAIVLVGDAGAIPYVSGLHAVDALGLGGYHGVPFVRAAVHGEAATLELIERLPPSERPTLLALYPNWFPGITGRFGHERDRVTITDNVICGGVTKGIYDADWSALGGTDPEDEAEAAGEVLDELDVADVLSEEAHGYVSPAPAGGWTRFDIRTLPSGARRFDAGRSVPAGREESFVLAAGTPTGTLLLVRTDDAAAQVTVHAGGATASADAPALASLVPDDATAGGAWRLYRAALGVPLAAGTRVAFRVSQGELHDFHAWFVRRREGGNP